jgi:hypothetical protein
MLNECPSTARANVGQRWILSNGPTSVCARCGLTPPHGPRTAPLSQQPFPAPNPLPLAAARACACGCVRLEGVRASRNATALREVGLWGRGDWLRVPVSLVSRKSLRVAETRAVEFYGTMDATSSEIRVVTEELKKLSSRARVDQRSSPRADPATRRDGRCPCCGRERPEVAVKNDDPFCSTGCARSWHEVASSSPSTSS